MAAQTSDYDVIVIGAGIEGSSSAYALAKEGQKVLLLEQFPLPHSRGSSGGHSRITRYAYGDEFYIHMMKDCFPMWDQLAKEAGTELFLQCGCLDLQMTGSTNEAKVVNSLRQHQIPHEVLHSEEISSRFPALASPGPRAGAVWDPSGGLLKSDKCLAAFQKMFKEFGGVIHDGEPVTSVQPGNPVTVMTSRSVYRAPKVVIAAGPWTGRFTKDLGLDAPMQPIRVNVLYWSPLPGKVSDHNWTKLPCIIDSRKVTGSSAKTFHIYALPEDEYPGLVKVCLHTGVDIDPDERDTVDTQFVRDTVRKYVKELFPMLRHERVTVEESCIYTVTPDHHPYIDKHPNHPNIVIAGGFSGHGFKLAPAVGKAVSELVLDEPLSYNMNSFKLDRFTPKANL